MVEIELDWKGPYRIEEFIRNPDNEMKYSIPGVYIWKEHESERNVFSYVGKSDSCLLYTSPSPRDS